MFLGRQMTHGHCPGQPTRELPGGRGAGVQIEAESGSRQSPPLRCASALDPQFFGPAGAVRDAKSERLLQRPGSVTPPEFESEPVAACTAQGTPDRELIGSPARDGIEAAHRKWSAIEVVLIVQFPQSRQVGERLEAPEESGFPGAVLPDEQGHPPHLPRNLAGEAPDLSESEPADLRHDRPLRDRTPRNAVPLPSFFGRRPAYALANAFLSSA